MSSEGDFEGADIEGDGEVHDQVLGRETEIEHQDSTKQMYAALGETDFSSLSSAVYTDDANAGYHTVYGGVVKNDANKVTTNDSIEAEEVTLFFSPASEAMVVSEEVKGNSGVAGVVLVPVLGKEVVLNMQDNLVPDAKDAEAFDCLKRACAAHGMKYPSLGEFMQNSARGTLTDKKREDKVVSKNKEDAMMILNKKRSKDSVTSINGSSSCKKKRIAELKEKITMLKKKKEGLGLGAGEI